MTAYVMLGLYVKKEFCFRAVKSILFLQALKVHSFLVERKEYK